VTAAEWWRCARAGALTSGDVDAFLALPRQDRQRIERRAREATRHADPAVRAMGARIIEGIVVAEWGEHAPPLSRHLQRELDAMAAGRELAPGAPVPRCGCEACTGIPDKPAQKAQKSARRDLRPALDVDAARTVPILDVAARYGIEHRRGWALCPFHDDSSPSFHLNASRNRAFCNPCGRAWDPIALTMEMGRMDFAHAVRELTGEIAA
jgi:hypothetical protein